MFRRQAIPLVLRMAKINLQSESLTISLNLIDLTIRTPADSFDGGYIAIQQASQFRAHLIRAQFTWRR